jgi:hypothetical protein
MRICFQRIRYQMPRMRRWRRFVRRVDGLSLVHVQHSGICFAFPLRRRRGLGAV